MPLRHAAVAPDPPGPGSYPPDMSVFTWPPPELGEVPARPGVYLFRAQSGSVLYVGKALDLRQRLASYRSGGDGRYLVRFLERTAQSVETIVTRTEKEALLLEDELIKRHQPPHNVRLKDDKSFLMIRVDLEERFPRLKFVRAHRPREGKGGGRSRLFGPFASARAVRQAIADLHRIVPLRDCTDQVLAHRLDRNGPLDVRIERLVDDPHRPLAQGALDLVLAEGLRVRHRSRLRRGRYLLSSMFIASIV